MTNHFRDLCPPLQFTVNNYHQLTGRLPPHSCNVTCERFLDVDYLTFCFANLHIVHGTPRYWFSSIVVGFLCVTLM